MVDWPRRGFLAGMLTAPFWAQGARAEEVIDLDWSDLLPQTEGDYGQVLRGLVQHEAAPQVSEAPAPGEDGFEAGRPKAEVRTDWNGKTVRIPGYIVPIEYDGSGVTAFILVPYMGACVHVPPPPANQLVFVTTSTPYESSGLFEAVNVTGMFGVSAMSTHLAEIGYALSADKIEPFDA